MKPNVLPSTIARSWLPSAAGNLVLLGAGLAILATASGWAANQEKTQKKLLQKQMKTLVTEAKGFEVARQLLAARHRTDDVSKKLPGFTSFFVTLRLPSSQKGRTAFSMSIRLSGSTASMVKEKPMNRRPFIIAVGLALCGATQAQDYIAETSTGTLPKANLPVVFRFRTDGSGTVDSI